MSVPAPDWTSATTRLGGLLAEAAPWWRSMPFAADGLTHAEALCGPALWQRLQDLGDDTVARLSAGDHDDHALHALLEPALPILRDFAATLECIHAAPAAAKAARARASRDVPGRKQAEIDAFVAQLGTLAAPALEWCAGKGHLGRALALRDSVEVCSVERDAGLCADGEKLARRDGTRQSFVRADVMDEAVGALCAGRHALALHACGDLHRRLVGSAAAFGLRALDLAPCCYHYGTTPEVAHLAGSAELPLSPAERRLAVTGFATASAAERAAALRELGWKFAWRELRARCHGANLADLHGDFQAALPASRGVRRGAPTLRDWCAPLATAAGIALPGDAELAACEASGRRLARQALRANLVRLAFRRPLEAWLVLRLAVSLQAQGFAVTLRRFCAETVTPRNLLLSARA